MQDLLSFVLAGLALAGSPGPANLSLAATGAAFGPRRGLAYMAGIIAGMVAVMVITASGVAGLLLALPGARLAVTALAAVYFVYLALRIATAPPLSDATRPRRRPVSSGRRLRETGARRHARRKPNFMTGIILSLLNPKGYAAMAALFSGFALIRERLALDAAVKIAVLTAIIVAVNLAWLFAGAALTRHFRDPGTNRAINLGFAILLVASVAAALLI